MDERIVRYDEKMQKTMNNLGEEFGSIRAGRANPHVLDKLKADILNQVSFIESKITQYGLDGYSLYIYLLPFANADEDKKNIIDKLLQSGGGMP